MYIIILVLKILVHQITPLASMQLLYLNTHVSDLTFLNNIHVWYNIDKLTDFFFLQKFAKQYFEKIIAMKQVN